MGTPEARAGPPTLGSTAMEVWKAWRGQPYEIGNPCYAIATDASLSGEITWQNDGIYRVDAENPSQATRLSNAEEDRVWDALVAGHMRIYRNQRVRGKTPPAVTVLHEATGASIPDGM